MSTSGDGFGVGGGHLNSMQSSVGDSGHLELAPWIDRLAPLVGICIGVIEFQLAQATAGRRLSWDDVDLLLPPRADVAAGAPALCLRSACALPAHWRPGLHTSPLFPVASPTVTVLHVRAL